MNITQRLRATCRLSAGIVLSASVLLIAACQPIVDPSQLEQQPAAQEESASVAQPVFEVDPAMATVNARSLRVRQEPNDDSEQVTSITEGETYPVLAMSSDGAWLQLSIDRAPNGVGWTSTEFVTLEGDITNIETVEVAGAPAETEGTEEAATDAEPAATQPAVGMATIVTDLPLRVRSAPSAAEDNKIGNVFDGEVYPVLEVTEDGNWVKIDVPELAEDGGWVSTEFVTLQGDIAGSDPADAAETPESESTASAEASAETESTSEAGTEAAPAESEGATDAVPETEEDEFDQEAAVAAATPPAAGMALIVTDLPLRVRSAPIADEDNKIGNVFAEEVYPVLEVSEDGEWVKIDVPELAEDGGWVAAGYVVLGE